MLTVLPEPSRTLVALAAFTGLRAGEIRGLNWEAYSPRDPGDDGSLGVIRVLHSVWRGRIGEPKNSRSKAPVPLIPQLEAILERHREANGNPSSGPIFPNGAGKAFDLDRGYRRQMRDPLSEWGSSGKGGTASVEASQRHSNESASGMRLEQWFSAIPMIASPANTTSSHPLSKRLLRCDASRRRSRQWRSRNCSPVAPERQGKRSKGRQLLHGCSKTRGDVNAYD